MKHTREEIITALHIIKDTCNENGFACIMIYDDTNKDLVKAQIIFEFVWNKYLRVEQVNLENGDSYVGVNPSRYVAHGWIFGCE